MSDRSGAPAERGPDDDLAAIRRSIRRGELLEGYDAARSLLVDLDGPARAEATYLAALAAARSGAVEQAERLLDDLQPGADLDVALGEDVAGLEARLAKDRALATSGSEQQRRLREAAGLYEAAYRRYGRPYTCVNAATMWSLADEADRARPLAEAAAQLAPGDDYWDVATRAEAALVLGDLDAAARELAAAGAASTGEWSIRATTTRQLALVCRSAGVDEAILAPLANPTVFHLCGHLVDGDGDGARFPARAEAAVAAEATALLDDERLGIGFGALAAGADIVVAEQLLAAGGELHVVLPFSVEEFVATSVADAGARWVARFHDCLARASTVQVASDSEYLDDPAMFDFGARVAMGDALNRARELATDVVQVAVWDGADPAPGAVAGTAVDVARWRRAGHRTLVVDPGGRRGWRTAPPSPGADPPPPVRPPTDRSGARTVRALLFADVAGFSTIGDGQLPAFLDHVMGSFARAIEAFAPSVLLRRTWGDGIHLVFDDVVPAARCALTLVEAMAQLDLEALGLGTLRGLRVGVHAGPVFDRTDPVTGQHSVIGADVTRTARIEPRTPEGQVYGTHPFAALLALAGPPDLRCAYVGRLPAAKGYGVLPMYRVVTTRT